MTSEPTELNQSSPEPRVRVRANFSRLVKTGWQFETTVELTFRAFVIDGDAAFGVPLIGESGAVVGMSAWDSELRGLVQQANRLGQDEVDRLNALDALNPAVAA